MTVTLSPSDTLDGFTPIQLGLEVTGQLQSLSPVTRTSRRPPEAGNVNDVGDTRGEPAHWKTLTLTPPIVTVPERATPGFASTSIGNLPADAEEAAMIHVSLAVACQLQPLSPDTVTGWLPAEAVKRKDRGVTLAVQPDSCSTSTVTPPIDTVPDRAGPSLAPTPIVKGPGDAEAPTRIHVSLSLTDQLQPLSPDTLTCLLPGESVKLNSSGDTRDGDPGHWRTSTISSPIVTVPVRVLEPLLGPNATDTLWPVDTVDGLAVIQSWSELTGQLQPLSPVTVTRSVPPAAGKLNEGGDTRVGEDGHWLTLTISSPIVTLPAAFWSRCWAPT